MKPYDAWRQTAPLAPPVAPRLMEMFRHFEGHDSAASQFALVLLCFLWQEARENRPASTPSLLLVDASRAEGYAGGTDLLDPVFAAENHTPGRPAYPSINERHDSYRQLSEVLGWNVQYHAKGLPIPWFYKKRWFELVREVFGCLYNRGGYYARKHPVFGVVTEADPWRPFSITTDLDFSAFREELVDPDGDPFRPDGPDGYRGGFVAKHTPVLGSIALPAFQGAWLDIAIQKGQPLLFAPFCSLPTKPLPHLHEFKQLVSLLSLGLSFQKERWERMPVHRTLPEVSAYMPLIRSHLRHLPGEYEYFILGTIHSLTPMVCTLSRWLGPQCGDHLYTIATARYLLERAVRGIAFGLEALVYHGIGVEFRGVKRKHCLSVLTHLRTVSEPVTRRALQRKVQSLAAADLDVLLPQLEALRLVTLSGKSVQAITLGKFLADLPSTPGMPPPPGNLPEWPASKRGPIPSFLS